MIKEPFQCMQCRGSVLIRRNDLLICKSCNASYRISNGIYIFNIDAKLNNRLIWDNRSKRIENNRIVMPYKSLRHQISAKMAREEFEKIILPQIEGNSVLEIGCGQGQFLNLLEKSKKFKKVYGLDYSYDMLLNCPQGPVKINGNAAALPFKDNSIDVVLFVTVLMHNQEISTIIKEAQRIARKYIVIQENTGSFLSFMTKKYVFPRSLEIYKKAITNREWSNIYLNERRAVPAKTFIREPKSIHFVLSKLGWLIFKKKDYEKS